MVVFVSDKVQYLKFLQCVFVGCATCFRQAPAHDQTLRETDQPELSLNFILCVICDRLKGEFSSYRASLFSKGHYMMISLVCEL